VLEKAQNAKRLLKRILMLMFGRF